MPVFNLAAFKEIAKGAGDTRPHHVVKRTGLNSGLVSRLLNDEREPQLATVVRLANAYRVPVDSLVNRENAA